MSHNVDLSGVVLMEDDIEFIERAVEELAEDTPGLAFQKGGTFRTYRGHETADYVIKCPGNYDVGLIRGKDGKLTPRLEAMASDVRAALGAQPGTVKNDGEACSYNDPATMVGRLVQRVGVLKAESEAARNGRTSAREYDRKTGHINLVVEMA